MKNNMIDPKNIQEYVSIKVIEHLKEINNVIEEKDIKIEKMKNLLRDNDICFECICSKCNRKIEPNDDHSHNTYESFPTLCYKCFFSVL